MVLLAKIWQSVKDVLPVNRYALAKFSQSDDIWRYIDSILAGIEQAGLAEDSDAKFNLWSDKFKSYVEKEETRMDETLRTLSYCIDAENTLSLIVGRYSRPEQVWIGIFHAATTHSIFCSTYCPSSHCYSSELWPLLILLTLSYWMTTNSITWTCHSGPCSSQ